MEQKYREYPVFRTGDVLTSDSLTNMVGYIDEQGDLSRAYLCGSGILSGLDFSYEPSTNKFIIKPGVAVTRSGRIIQIDEQKKFITYESKNGITFERDETTLRSTTSEPVFAIRYELLQDDVIGNNQLTGDVNKASFTIDIKAIVLPGDPSPRVTFLTGIQTKVTLSPFADICASHNLITLKYLSHTNFVKNKASLLTALKAIKKIFAESPKTGDNDLSAVFSDWNESLDRYAQAISEIDRLGENNDLPLLYNDFFMDMENAVNEFVDAYNAFSKKYQYLHRDVKLDGVENGGDIVVLGKLGEGNKLAANDKYRDYFKPAFKPAGFNEDAAVLHRLFERICWMALRYNDKSNTTEAKIIPYRPADCLGSRVIPWYYDSSAELVKYWQAQCTGNCEAVTFNDYDCNNASAWAVDSVFSVQGCCGASKDSVVKQLSKIIDDNNLPIAIDLKPLDLKEVDFINKKGTSGKSALDDFKNSFLGSKITSTMKGLFASTEAFIDRFGNNTWQPFVDAFQAFLDAVSKNSATASQIRMAYEILTAIDTNKAKEALKNDTKAQKAFEEVKSFVSASYNSEARFGLPHAAKYGQTIVVACSGDKVMFCYGK